MTPTNLNLEHFLECSFPLVQWADGTELWSDMLTKVESYTDTLQKLNDWKAKGLIIPKPTLSSDQTLIFWIHDSLVPKALKLTGIRGGFKLSPNKFHDLSLTSNQHKKKVNRSQRVLLDLGCDSPELVAKLRQCGLIVNCVWDYLSDLYHYELIQQCLNQSFDILVSKNERLFTPVEEWIQYLFPKKTKLLIVPEKRFLERKNPFDLIYNMIASGFANKEHLIQVNQKRIEVEGKQQNNVTIDNHKSEDKDSKKFKSQHTDSNELNFLINKTEKIGSQASETGSIIEIREFIGSWNRISDAGKEPTISMINSYNSIKINHNLNSYAIQKKDGKMYIRDYHHLNSIIEPWFTGNKPVYPLRYKEWLVFTEKINGTSAFIKIWISNSDGSKDLFLVQNTYLNKKPAWNPNGIQKGQWKAKHSFINCGLFEEVDISGRKNPLKLKIIKELEKKYCYPKDWQGQKRWINKLFRLKYNQDIVDEFLEIQFYDKMNSTRNRLHHVGKQFLKNYYNKFGQLSYVNIDVIETEDFYTGELNPFFEIAFIDESRALKAVIRNLKNVNKHLKWNQYIKQLYNRRPLYSFVRLIHKERFSAVIRSNISYSLFQAEKYLGRGNSLTRIPKEFWNEQGKDGFTKFAKALISDINVRKSINMFTGKFPGLSKLRLRHKVIGESKWGRDTSNHNFVSVPDIITRYMKGKKLIASETVQNKLARRIGKKSGEINSEHFMLDYLKTIGNYDLVFQPLNLQFEFVPFSKTLGGITAISKENNIVIISYWRDLKPEFIRFGEIISAFHRIGKYGRNIIDEKKILNELYDLMDYGRTAMGFKRVMDSSTKKMIKIILNVAKKSNGDSTFYHGAFLEFLKRSS